MALRSDQSIISRHTELVEFSPVVPRRTFEHVVLQFEEAILGGRLRAGQKLPSERELSEQFGVSRSSLREALRVLEILGVVTARRGSGGRAGTYVEASQNGLAALLPLYAKLRAVPLGDLVDIRVAIEGMAAAGAASHGVEAARALEPILIEMRQASRDTDFLAADTRFHLEIARHSGNSVAPLFMESIREAMAREMLAAFQQLTDWKTERDNLVEEHSTIRTRISTGDARGAKAAIEKHIRDFYSIILAMEID